MGIKIKMAKSSRKNIKTIVNNESSHIIRIFNSAFNKLSDNVHDYYPKHLRQEIDYWNKRIYEPVNNGVYKAGFATTQKAYDDAVTTLFKTLDDIDNHLKNLIKSEIEGEVYFDDVTREIYSTDASIYRIVPLCVVTPKTIKDIKTLVQISNEYGIPILPRGGGSSLSGQTVNKAIVIDFTKHINKVMDVDKNSMTAIAQLEQMLQQQLQY